MKIAKKIGFAALVAAFLFTSIALVRTGDLYFQIKKQLTIFSDVYKEVATMYVDEVSPERLMNRGINAMLEELDPYTVFIGEGEQQEMEILSSGSYGGIGIEVGFRGDDIVIIAPMDGYPADRAGIRPGDILVRINGISTEGMSAEEVQQLTIGDSGTEVTISVLRPGMDQELEYTLERERIEVQNITYIDHFGEQSDLLYLQLNRFGQQSAEEVRDQLLASKDEGNLNGLILDLRNNPGGLLNEAVEIVDKFVEPGVTIVETRGRMDAHNSAYVTEEPAIFEDLPIIVLMNRGSASASEVVAGAFQDLDRAVVIGESSFGKGLVQTIRPLSYNTSLKVTVSKYLTPSGRSIQSIDYANEEGGIGREIPDSLRRPFQTKNGRTVFDGQGIDPDINVDDDAENRAEAAMLQNNHFFFFVNETLASMQEDEPDFPSEAFEQFLDYLDEQNFEYSLPAKDHLDQLKQHAEDFSDKDEFHRQIDELQASLVNRKQQEIEDSREFIEKHLHREWTAQIHGGDARTRIMLDNDRFMNEAIELLLNNDNYKSILRP